METHSSWKRNVMRHTGMNWRPRLPVLSSVTGRIIVGFGLLIIILVAVVVGSAWLVREQGSDLAFWLLVISGAGGAVTGLAASALIARSIRRALSSLESAALAMAGGDLAARAPTTGPRELARLGSALNQMTDSLLGASERRDPEETLPGSAEYFRALIEHAPDIITILDGDGTIRYASPSVQRVLGYEPEELIDRDAFGLVHPDDMPTAIVNFSLLLLDPGTPRSATFRLRHADGSWRTLEAMGNNVIDDSRLAIVFSYRDISERRRAEEPEGFLAHHARLADPPNRALLDDRFTRTLAQALRTDQALAVMSLHLDRFSVINDGVHYTSEHHLLRAAGQRLTGLMRECDAVARVGDDEFIVLSAGTAEAADATNIAEGILEALRPPFHFDGQVVHATTSIGISLCPYDGEDAATLLKNADAAMCRAKEKGRNNHQLYTVAMAAKRHDLRPLHVGGTAGPVPGSHSEVPPGSRQT